MRLKIEHLTHTIFHLWKAEKKYSQNKMCRYIFQFQKNEAFCLSWKNKNLQGGSGWILNRNGCENKNGEFIFETSHFSVYTLIEESLRKEIMLVILSILVFAGILVYLRKKKK